MTFDNGKTIIALRLRVFIATVLLIVYIYFTYLGKELKFPVVGLSSNTWTLILLAIYAIIAFYPMLFNYRYFYFSDDGPQLLFRYYSVGLLKGRKSSIEIPKNEFAGYTLEPYGGAFRMITLSRKIDRRIAKYPPIHLGALNKNEIEKLTSSLDLIEVAK